MIDDAPEACDLRFQHSHSSRSPFNAHKCKVFQWTTCRSHSNNHDYPQTGFYFTTTLLTYATINSLLDATKWATVIYATSSLLQRQARRPAKVSRPSRSSRNKICVFAICHRSAILAEIVKTNIGQQHFSMSFKNESA